MIIDPSQSSSHDVYALLISTVVPRPIAWVSTLSSSGVVNLAPFSFFQAIGSRPPMVSIAFSPRPHSRELGDKDTLRNIKESGEFVVNIATTDKVDDVNQSSASYPPERSEVAELGLAILPSDLVKPPRLADSPVHFECRLERVIPMGHEPPVHLVIGEIVRFHVADKVWDPETRTVIPEKLKPLARLGGSLYASLGEIMSRPRPA